MKKILIAIALSSLVSASAFAQGEWICKTEKIGADLGVTVVYDANKNLARVYQTTYAGTKLSANLTICASEQISGNDTSTTVTCHDGLWQDSKMAVLELGGFLPTIGKGEYFVGGPENYTLDDSMICRWNIATDSASTN